MSAFGSNPFGAWSEAGQGQSSGSIWGNGIAPAPSVFGALPYPANPSIISFYFTSFNPNIFNSTILGPNAKPQYYIVTDNQMPGYTVIKNTEGKNVSLIEWQQHPFTEVRGTVLKQQVRTWLRLSPNKDFRSMDVRGMKYMWVPRDKSINLYAGSSGSPTYLGRITRSNGAIVLEMTPDAMQLGLLDVAVTAALLLQCGRNID